MPFLKTVEMYGHCDMVEINVNPLKDHTKSGDAVQPELFPPLMIW